MFYKPWRKWTFKSNWAFIIKLNDKIVQSSVCCSALLQWIKSLYCIMHSTTQFCPVALGTLRKGSTKKEQVVSLVLSVETGWLAKSSAPTDSLINILNPVCLSCTKFHYFVRGNLLYSCQAYSETHNWTFPWISNYWSECSVLWFK